MKTQQLNIRNQGGAALIIGLTLLMALTIIGIGSLSTTSLEHRMAGNMADSNIAFNAAESAAREISGLTITTYATRELPDCAEYPTATTCIQSGLAPNWWDAPWVVGTISASNDFGARTVPVSVIEQSPRNEGPLGLGHKYGGEVNIYYRITTRSVGLSNNSTAMVQQVVKKKVY